MHVCRYVVGHELAVPCHSRGPADCFVARVVKASVFQSKQLTSFRNGGLPVLRGNDFDRVRIMAAVKRRQVANVDAGAAFRSAATVL